LKIMADHGTADVDVGKLSAQIDDWSAKGGPPAIRELTKRSRCTHDTSPAHGVQVTPLFREAARNSMTSGRRDSRGITTRGIVMCCAPDMVSSLLHALQRVRLAGSDLPVQIWHVGELNASVANRLQKEEGVSVHDLLDAVSPLPEDEVQDFRGFMCKPLAMLASSFTEVMSIDHDGWAFMNISDLFHSKPYLESGMLVFRDRLQMKTPSKQKEAGHFLRDLIRRRVHVPHFFGDTLVGPMHWRPSSSLLQAPIVKSQSNHHADSSIVLLNKAQAVDMANALYALHDKYRYEMYNNFHGDKETFWIACELVGKCGVSPLLPGIMGEKKDDDDCVHGNMLQFHPDHPERAVHCNCKPEALWYTVVGLPQAAQVEDADESQPSAKVFEPKGTKYPFKACAKLDDSITVREFLKHQLSFNQSFDDQTCESDGTMCHADGTCWGSSECALA